MRVDKQGFFSEFTKHTYQHPTASGGDQTSAGIFLGIANISFALLAYGGLPLTEGFLVDKTARNDTFSTHVCQASVYTMRKKEKHLSTHNAYRFLLNFPDLSLIHI